MDIKKKFKSLITKQIPRSLSSESQNTISSEPSTPNKDEAPEFLVDLKPDQAILDSVEPIYFSDESFDSSDYELQKLPEVLEPLTIDEAINKLVQQGDEVYKKVLELLLENQSSYTREFQRVTDLQYALQTATEICSNGRRHLAQTKQKFTTASLGILANYRKRQQLIKLLHALHTIKTLQRTDMRLKEMLKEKDFVGAILVCLECQKVAGDFRHYNCIRELSSKLQLTLEMIEEQLDADLAKVCTSFDTKHYEKLQTAYRLLGKTQIGLDQLHMHYASTIHNTAFTKVLGHVALSIEGANVNNYNKKQYPNLCKDITIEHFTPCLIDLCKSLWEIMNSYHKTMEWHEKYDLESGEETTGSSNVEASFNRRYVKQKLEHGLIRIWQDIQQKVKIHVSATDLSGIKFKEFIYILDLVNRLIQIGAEFCGNKSEHLQEAIRKQSINFFRNYHRDTMDKLRMFLENEGWKLCTKANFNILQLPEFKFLRNYIPEFKSVTNSSTPVSSPAHLKADANKEDSFFIKFSDQGNPFDIQLEEDEEDLVTTNGYEYSNDAHLMDDDDDDESDDSDVPDELKQDFIDEHGDAPLKIKHNLKHKKQGMRSNKGLPPILANTTWKLLRLFGEYMQMMNMLKPIAFDVIICMSQLFDFYLYSVYCFFATEMGDFNERVLSNKLRTNLKRICDNMIFQDEEFETTVDDRKDKVAQPYLSPTIDLTRIEKLYGLAERVVAIESLIFLADQLEFLQNNLEAVIPQAKKVFLKQFYTQSVSTAQELRKPVYGTVSAKSVDYEQLLQHMANVKWDLKEIMSQHSFYVDHILRELQVFSMRLDEVSKHVPIPKKASGVIWEHCIRLVNRTLVEGYSCAKKCTNEGRALMQLDFQQFLMKIAKITDKRPIPDKDFVEFYIKAFYLPDNALEDWIKTHSEYSIKQLLALVNLSHVNKKTRQKLTSMIEEWDRIKR